MSATVNSSATDNNSKSMFSLPPPVPKKPVSIVMMPALFFIVHTFFNSFLLLPLWPLRCLYWNKMECTEEEGWALNWYIYSHCHVATLLAFLGHSIINDKVDDSSGSDKNALLSVYYRNVVENNFAQLCCTIIICYIIEGILSYKKLQPNFSLLQCFIYLLILIVIVHSITSRQKKQHNIKLLREIVKEQEEEGTTKAMSSPSSSERATVSSSTPSSNLDRQKIIEIPTLALGMQVLLSAFQVADMTFDGTSIPIGYLGDTSSPVFQTTSQFALCDMVLVTIILGYGFYIGHIEQHRAILRGQASILLVSQLLIVFDKANQTMVDSEQIRARMVGTFVNIIIAVVGAL